MNLLNGCTDMQQWMIYTKKADFYGLAAKYHISPVLARILVNRGIREEEFDIFLHGSIMDLHDPELLPDAEKAADLILRAVSEQKKIRIVGDYDVDGVCSTYLLLTFLERIGADVSYDIPHRIHDGYGINRSIIDRAQADGIGMIVTCDNGISAADAVAYAKSLGMQVVVTDHHEVPEILPEADAVVNPKCSGSMYPFREICGGMVVFQLGRVLYEKAGVSEEEWAEMIEFAAIATVADVMPLTDENRIVVKVGLKHLPYTQSAGLKKLISVCGLDIYAMTAFSIGFVIGPCLNASGRLESAKTALELLRTKDEGEAEKIAHHLRDLNDERKEMTEHFAAEAIRQIEERYREDPVKLVYLPECHEAIAGIIAGRIKEHYHHPAIVMTDSEDGNYKGSARSVEAYNIYEKLTEAAAYIEKFGGHRMAAGLTVAPDRLDGLRTFLNANAGLTEEDCIEKLWIDTVLPLRENTEELIAQLSLLEPFGQGNEKPAFALKNVEVLYAKVMGKLHNLVKLRIKDEAGNSVDALCFGDGDQILSELAQKRMIDILYYPQVNVFQGQRSIQLVLKGWR